jgi:hypothetical protein
MAAKTEVKDGVRDRSTAHGAVVLRTLTFEKYLADLHIYDPKARTVNIDADRIAVGIQRAAMKIQANHILERMMETLLRGGLLPTIALQESSDGTLRILDGLQRSNCMARALEYLLAWEADATADVPEFAQRIIEKVGPEHLISSADYLRQPIFAQVWRDLTESEAVRLFLALNIGQQKVSLRHILESLGHQLADLFTSWGLQTYSEKAQRAERGTTRGRRPRVKTGDAGDAPTATSSDGAFKLEFLINATRAYVGRDPHVKTRKAVTEAYQADEDLAELGPRLIQSLTALGDEADTTARDDFLWVFQSLNSEIGRIYEANPKWRNAVATSDNFTLPLMAALGKARETDPAEVDDRKQRLLDLLDQSDPGTDPLALSETDDSLDAILLRTRHNIAAKVCRNTVYGAAREYFRIGPIGDVIFDWAEATKRQ